MARRISEGDWRRKEICRRRVVALCEAIPPKGSSYNDCVIDNYDSFTYNLVQYLGDRRICVRGEHAREIRVWRNDEIDVEELAELHPTHIVISPGPGSPEKDSGVSNDVIRVLGQTTPILGVCLGQQCMGYVFGGQVVRAPRLMHGKVSPVHHKGKSASSRGCPAPSPPRATTA
jgi:anthranilate synthase/aminodeoxychorismate synthase-like glutamine amidotransferase